MTVVSEQSVVGYVGNGATTVFPVPFPFPTAAALVVTLAGVTQTLGIDYTLAGGDPTGSVTMLVAPPDGDDLVIERTLPLVQETAFTAQGTFSPVVHEHALDYATMLVQQVDRRVTDLETEVSTLDDRVTTEVAALEARLDTANNGLAALDGRVDLLEAGAGPAMGSTLNYEVSGTASFTTAATAPVDATGATVTLVSTAGRPLFVMLQPATGTEGSLDISASGQLGDGAIVRYTADTGAGVTVFGSHQVAPAALGITQVALGGFAALWVPPGPGSYVIRAQLGVVRGGPFAGTFVHLSNAQLVVIEL